MKLQWPKFNPRKPGTPDNVTVKELKMEVSKLQYSISILLGDNIRVNTDGNPYPDYKTAIAEVAKKYEGIAEWGVQQVRNIVDVRAAFTIGQGIKLSGDRDKYPNEFDFIDEFLKFNNLDEEAPQDLAKEAEIEGRSLVKMVWDEEKQMSSYRFISYSINNYEVKTKDNDYQKYTEVVYKLNGADQKIEAKDFVYKKFAGRICKVNDIMPKVAMILRHCEDLDKALYDWRLINNLFAAPTPYFKCQNAEEAKKLQAVLKELNWKIGKALCGTAEFSLVGVDGTGIDSLEKEIVSLIKVISGNTGVPVHFLGFPDLMSNRAVSTDLFESLNASTSKEKHVWEGFYEELFDKAIEQYNANTKKTRLQTGVVKAQIISFTAEQMNQLANIWLPLFQANVIDLDYMLSKIPDADPKKIKKSADEANQKMLQSIKDQEAAAAKSAADNPEDPSAAPGGTQ